MKRLLRYTFLSARQNRNNVFFVLLVLIYSCSNKHSESDKIGFELRGKLTDSKGEVVYLEQMSPDGLKIIDTTEVDEKGEFLFTTRLPEAGFYNVKISNRNFATLILDSTQKVFLEGNTQDLGNTYKVKGSEDSRFFWELNETSKDNYRKRDSLQKSFETYLNLKSENKKIADSLYKVIEISFAKVIEKQNKYLTEFIDSHTASFASLAAIQQLDYDQYIDYYEKLDKSLNEKYPGSKYVNLFHNDLIQRKKLAVGAEAPEISLSDPKGSVIALSSLKGKIVLIDFWASWCAPCRAEIPGLVQVYNKYKLKGFEIYSVSIDKEKDKWLEAIKKENMTWTHVSDLKQWNSAVVKLYNFQSIPCSYLIDKEGKILAKNLTAEELAAKLEEIFAVK